MMRTCQSPAAIHGDVLIAIPFMVVALIIFSSLGPLCSAQVAGPGQSMGVDTSSTETIPSGVTRMRLRSEPTGDGVFGGNWGGVYDQRASHSGLPVSQSTSQPCQFHVTKNGRLAGHFSSIRGESGRLTPAKATAVYLVRSGTIVARTQTNPDGLFQMTVSPGVYAVIAVGGDGLAASAVHVLPECEGDEPPHAVITASARQVAAAVRAKDNLEVAVVPQHNIDILEQLLQQRAAGQAPIAAAAPGPPRVRIADNAARTMPAAYAAPRGCHVVRLRPDGRLVGRMGRLHLHTGALTPVSPLSVYFLHKGALAANTTVSESGEFELRGLEPGVYSVVAIGIDGFAAFDAMVLPPGGIAGPPRGTSSFQPVSAVVQTPAVPSELVGSLVAPQDAHVVLAQYVPDPPEETPGDPTGPPGTMGNATGGGFGGILGGRLGTLTGALMGAGIAAGVVAAVTDHNDKVASPFGK